MTERGTTGRSGQQRGGVARARILDAGFDVFAGLTLDELLHEVGPRRIARELGDLSTGAFYHHFPNRQAFLGALLDHVLGRPDEVAAETVALIDDLVHRDPPDALRATVTVARNDFNRQVTDGLTDIRFQLCAWVAHGEPSVAASLRDYYERFTAQYAAAYELLLARWGREVRPPFTLVSAAVVLTALVEGMILRSCVDPEVAGPDLFEQAVLSLLPVLTRKFGDPASLDDVVADLRRFAGRPLAEAEDPEVRRRVLDTVLARADADTFDDASIAEIARDAGVQPEDVHRRYLSKPGLVAATFARFVPLLERAVAADLASETPPTEAIQRHLVRLAETAGRHRALTNMLVESVVRANVRFGERIGASDPRAIVPLPQVLEPVIRAAQAAGTVRADFPPLELAALVTNFLLLRIVTRPSEPPAESARIAGEVILHGIGT